MSDRGIPYEGLAPPSVTSTGTERRVALVIGNSAYPSSPLRNPRNDAEALAAKLRALAPTFEVTLALDVGRDRMEDALELFESQLGACDTALLFFAGHGLQVKGVNYLMPVDADIRQEIHLKRRAISLNEILDIMGRRVRKSSLVFLDACRDNPFARSLLSSLPDEERARTVTRSGLAEVRAGTGSFVAFATAPDNVAMDGHGANSPFTEALLQHIATPGASINDVMIAVRRDVLKATGGRQEPWDQSSLRDRFCFQSAVLEIPATALTTSPQPVVSPSIETTFSEAAVFERAAIEHWDNIKGTSEPAVLLEFLADYGTSRMGKLARDALQKLATLRWKRINKHDEIVLSAFIADFPDTKEIADAGAARANIVAAREAEALKVEAQKACDENRFKAKQAAAEEKARRRAEAGSPKPRRALFIALACLVTPLAVLALYYVARTNNITPEGASQGSSASVTDESPPPVSSIELPSPLCKTLWSEWEEFRDKPVGQGFRNHLVLGKLYLSMGDEDYLKPTACTDVDEYIAVRSKTYDLQRRLIFDCGIVYGTNESPLDRSNIDAIAANELKESQAEKDKLCKAVANNAAKPKKKN